MGETTGTPQNSQDDEQKNSEGGADQEPKGETVTAVIETPVTEKPVKEQEEQISVTNEPVEDTAAEAITETENPADTKESTELPSNEINSAEITESTVTIKTLVEEPVLDDDGNPTGKTEDVESDAAEVDVFFTNGCVNGDKLVKDKDLTFKISAGEGRKLVSWGYLLSDAKEDAKPSLSTTFPIECKVPYGTLVTKTNTKSITIYVKTEAAGYKVTFKGAAGSTAGTDFDIYEFATGDDAGKLAKTPITAESYEKVIKQGEQIDYALVVKNDKILDEGGITLNGNEVEFEDKDEFSKVDDTEGAELTEAYPFTLDPSAYGLDSTGNNTEAVVSVAVRSEYALTVTAINEAGNTTLVEHSGTGDDLIKATVASNKATFTTTDLVESKAEENDGKKLAFAVKPDDNYVIKSAKATVTDTDSDEKIAEFDLDGEPITTGDNEGNIEYTVEVGREELVLDANKTLSIVIEAELDPEDDDAKQGIHRIMFEAAEGSDLRNVTINDGKTNLSNEQIADVIRTEGNTYTLKISPKDGYQLTVGGDDAETQDKTSLAGEQIITISEKRFYENAETEGKFDEEKTVEYQVKAYTPAKESDPEAIEEITLKLAGNSDKYHADDPDAADVASREYVTTAVTVTIGATPLKNEDEKLIAFDNQIQGATYAVTNAKGVLKDQYPADAYKTASETDPSLKDNIYTIAESEDLLTFTVTSTVKPEVKRFEDSTEKETLEAREVNGNVYTYALPTHELTDETSTVNKIVIKKELGDAKDVKVKIDKTANLKAEGGFVYKIDRAEKSETLGSDNAEKDLTNKPNVNQEVEIVFTAAENVTFGDISCKMGEADVPVTLGATEDGKNRTATIKTVVTDNITIDVKTNAPYYVELREGGIEPGDGNGVYSADYTATGIKVYLRSAETDETADFYDIAVKDGSATAVTTAAMKSGYAEISKIAPEEWGKTLTIEVRKSRTEMYTATLVVSANSDEVTVTNLETNTVVSADDVITVRRDDSFSIRVTPKAGANKNDIKLMFCDATGKADSNAAKQFAEIEPTLNSDNEITLTAIAGDKAYDKDIYLGVFNTQKDKDGKEQKTPLNGGLIKIQVIDPVVKSADIAEVKVVPADSAGSANKSVGIKVDLGLAAKNAAVKMPLTDDLYYMIEIDGISGSVTEGTLKTVPKFTKFVQVPRTSSDGKNYDSSAFAVYREYNLVESYKGTEKGAKEIKYGDSGFDNLDIPGTISASAKVTLVQGLKGKGLEEEAKPAAADYVAGREGSASLATRLPVYETKLGVTKINGAAIFTGQKATVAVPKFTEATSYNKVNVTLVNAKTGSQISAFDYDEGYEEWNGISTGVNDDGSVWLKADPSVIVYDLQNSQNATTKDNFKNLAIKIVADYPVVIKDSKTYSGYAATAVLKVKVKQGIYSIEADQSKTALTTELYQDAKKGTVKSVKVTPMYNGGYKNYKPAKAAVTWEITDADGNGIEDLDPHMKEALAGKKPLITVKNGTISVAKTYKRAATEKNEDADTFYVTAKAADFTAGDERDPGENTMVPLQFTISGVNQTIGSLVVVDGSNKLLDAASLKAENFKSTLYVAAVKPGAEPNEATKIYQNDDFIPVTFKATGKLLKLGDFSGAKRKIEFLKPGTTKITATTVDGGKGTGTKATLDLTVAAYDKMGLELTSADGITTGADVTSIDYYGGSNARYTMCLQYKDGNEWKPAYDYKNVKVTVKNGKIYNYKYWKSYSDNYLGYAVVVTGKTDVATITLTDTASRKVLETYTITNKSANTAKAPSVKLKQIVDWGSDENRVKRIQKKVDKDSDELSFQVTASDKKLENYAGKYIKLTPDFTVDESKNQAYNWLGKVGVIEKIDENGQFITATERCRYGYFENGSYKAIATVGELKDGEFVPVAKDAKFSFNVSNKKYNDKLTVGAKYTLDAQGASRVPISVKTGVGYQVGKAENIITKEQAANSHMNNFTTYFEVKGNVGYLYNKDNNYGQPESYATIGLRDDLTAEQIRYITGQDAATAKAAKADCEGYINVWNGTYSKDVKITVSFKSVKLTAAADPVYASKNAVDIPIKVMNGKNEIKVKDVVLEGTSSIVDKINTDTKNDAYTATIKTVKNLTAGTYELNLKVLPLDSAYQKDMKEKAEDKTNMKDVTLTYGVPVTLKVEVKDLNDAKIIDVGKNLKYSLSSLKYSDRNGNGYQVSGTKGETGYYQINIPYTLAVKNAELTKNTTKDTYVKVDLDETLIKPDSKKRALVEADIAEVETYDAWGDTDGKKQVLQIRVAKQFIEACDKMDKKDKPLTGWNKKLTVPVSIQPINSAKEKAAAQTITFTLTTPKAPLTFAQVQEKIKAAGLEKIQAENYTTADGIVNSLRNKIWARLDTLVSADADAEIKAVTMSAGRLDNGNLDKAGNNTAIVNTGKAMATIQLDNIADKEAKPVEIDLNYNLLVKDSSGNVNAIKTAIESFDAATLGVSPTQDWKFTNDTTAAELLEKVNAIEAVRDILQTPDEEDNYSKDSYKSNISMKVTYFEKKNATTKTGSMTGGGEGYIAAKITIVDLAGGGFDRAVAYINLDEDDNVVGNNIKQLTNIVEAYTAVKTAFETKGTTPENIVQNCAGNEDRIKAEIKKIAEKAAKGDAPNSGITVTVPEDEDSFVFFLPTAEYVNDEGKTVPAKNGELIFRVILNEGGREKIYKASYTISKDDAGKFVELTGEGSALEKVEAVIKDDDELQGSLKTAIATEVNKLVADKKKVAAERNNAAKTAIEAAATGALKGVVYGYKATARVTDCTIATSGETGKVSFTVTVASLSDETATADITMTDAEYAAIDLNNITFAEFEKAWTEMTTEIEDTALPDDKEAALTAIAAEAKKLVTGSQTGDLAGTLTFKAESDADATTIEDGDDDGKVSGLNGVKVVIQNDSDTDPIYTTTTLKDFTFTKTTQ